MVASGWDRFIRASTNHSESRRSTRCAGGLRPQPRHPPPAFALPSRGSPRSLFKCLHTVLRVRSTLESFPSLDEHNRCQIDQIHIKGRRLDRGILRQPFRFYSPFRSSAILRSPTTTFSGKHFAALLPVVSTGITGPLVQFEFASASVRDSPDLAHTSAAMFSW